MPSYVNNVTATNKNNKVTICLGKKTRESYNISRSFYNCLHIHTEDSSGRTDSKMSYTWLPKCFMTLLGNAPQFHFS